MPLTEGPSLPGSPGIRLMRYPPFPRGRGWTGGQSALAGFSWALAIPAGSSLLQAKHFFSSLSSLLCQRTTDSSELPAGHTRAREDLAGSGDKLWAQWARLEGWSILQAFTGPTSLLCAALGCLCVTLCFLLSLLVSPYHM